MGWACNAFKNGNQNKKVLLRGVSIERLATNSSKYLCVHVLTCSKDWSTPFSWVTRRPEGRILGEMYESMFLRCSATEILQFQVNSQQITMTQNVGRPTDLLKVDRSYTTNCLGFNRLPDGPPIEKVCVIAVSNWKSYLGRRVNLRLSCP